MKKSLSQAIALATALGAAASAQAVNVNPDGLGNVLLYSLYTTEAGKNTTINITNTTDDYKAVKVRFVEAQNSKEVLDFNLYLSPWDQWGATVVVDEATGGAMLAPIVDTSCTAPEMETAENRKFKDYEYKAYPESLEGYEGDGGFDDLFRGRLGHVEVIEMGVVDPILGEATIKHGDNRVPANCDALRERFVGKDAPWDSEHNEDADLNDKILPATGGLYGTASIVDPAEANIITYDAVALDNFWDAYGLNHAYPGTTDPNLNNASGEAKFPDGQSIFFRDGIDAVSAVLMKSTIQNDYLVSDAMKGETNWVVTFPTRHHYVNRPIALAPFTEIWQGESGAPEAVTYEFWDNEEQTLDTPVVDLPPLLPSPLPPTYKQEKPGTYLRWETNIVKFDNKDVLATDYPHLNVPISDLSDFGSGWLRFDFTGHEMYGFGGLGRIEGLPVIGFSAIAVQNGYTGKAGAIANFSGQYQHKATTSVDETAVEPTP